MGNNNSTKSDTPNNKDVINRLNQLLSSQTMRQDENTINTLRLSSFSGGESSNDTKRYQKYKNDFNDIMNDMRLNRLSKFVSNFNQSGGIESDLEGFEDEFDEPFKDELEFDEQEETVNTIPENFDVNALSPTSIYDGELLHEELSPTSDNMFGGNLKFINSFNKKNNDMDILSQYSTTSTQEMTPSSEYYTNMQKYNRYK